MDFVKALKSNDYSSYFSEINSLEDKQNAIYQEVLSNIDKKFEKFLNDDSPDKSSEFRVPDLPKYRKDVKGNRTSRATKKASEISKTSGILHFGQPSGQQFNYQSADSTIGSQADNSFRRSSRIASKTHLKHEVPIIRPSHLNKTKRTNDDESTLTSFATAVESASEETFVISSQIPPRNIQEIPLVQPILPQKMKDDRILKGSTSSCTSSVAQSGPDSHKNNETFRRSYRVALKHSLEHAERPTDKKEDKTIVNQLPPSPCLPPTKMRCIDVTDSKKMSISKKSLDSSNCSSEIKEEPLGSSTPTNLTLETYLKKNKNQESTDTLKKQKLKATIFTEDTLSASKGRCTRNRSKILQEKNINVKLIEEKCHEAQKKKEVIMKCSAEETRRKREERTRKAAAARVEREKMELALKQEKEKEMKLKQMQKHKEEKLRIEVLKKKPIAAMKMAESEKRKLEQAKVADQKKPDSKQELCEYVILDGNSSDEEENPKSKIPSWAKKENRKHPLRVQAWLDREKIIRPWFFNKALKYPKLENLFSEKVKTRPRTSSAVWNNTVVDFDEAFPFN